MIKITPQAKWLLMVINKISLLEKRFIQIFSGES